MADDMNDRYKKAASLRLLSMIAPGMSPSQKPGVPNYNAIPLNPFDVPFNGLKNIPSWAGPDQRQDSATRFTNDPQSFEAPEQPPNLTPSVLPPFEQPGAVAQSYMPSHLPNPSRQGNYGPASAPAPAPMPAAPNPADAAYVSDPRTMGDADLGGYGGSPRIPGIAAPQQYSHLNPTPSLEEVFRREYAANPMAFGGKFG